MCSRLTGDSLCGSFGLEANGKQICRPREIVLLPEQLSQDSRLNVSLWFYAAEAAWDVHCHLWCTEDGQLPGPKSENLESTSPGLQDVLAGLVI